MSRRHSSFRRYHRAVLMLPTSMLILALLVQLGLTGCGVLRGDRRDSGNDHPPQQPVNPDSGDKGGDKGGGTYAHCDMLKEPTVVAALNAPPVPGSRITIIISSVEMPVAPLQQFVCDVTP